MHFPSTELLLEHAATSTREVLASRLPACPSPLPLASFVRILSMNFFPQKISQGWRVGLGIAQLRAKPGSRASRLAVLFGAYGIEWLLMMSFVL